MLLVLLDCDCDVYVSTPQSGDVLDSRYVLFRLPKLSHVIDDLSWIQCTNNLVPRTYLLELGGVLAAKAKPEANDILRSAVKGRHEQLGLQHVDTLKAQQRLADYLRRQAGAFLLGS